MSMVAPRSAVLNFGALQAKLRNVLVVAAAGNNGPGGANACHYSPASEPTGTWRCMALLNCSCRNLNHRSVAPFAAFAVGAMMIDVAYRGPRDPVPYSRDVRARFSNLGECVDLYAPGVGINTTTPYGCYTMVSGTSAAAAHTAGAAALVWQSSATPLTSVEVGERLIAISWKGKVSGAFPNRLLAVPSPRDPLA